MQKVLQRTTSAVHHAAQPAMLRDPRDVALGLRRSVAPSPGAGKWQYLSSSRYMLPQFVQMKNVSRQLPMLRQGQSRCRKNCFIPSYRSMCLFRNLKFLIWMSKVCTLDQTGSLYIRLDISRLF